ncbi:MFS transporter [Woodsholea maritima]|uniref:MFS transporter n=1 Tax=Woodsholea maritima TaxID=240237 RepID=UPI00036E5964|nr:MFS transporter [Woodsholea maritima]
MLLYRNVAAVMLACALMQISMGVLGIALPLAMSANAWSGQAIGLVASSYGAGFLVGAWIAPSIIQAIRHIRTYAALAGLAGAATLMLALGDHMVWWMLARFMFGAGVAGLLAVAESWIADATPAENRGAVVSAYQILGRAGLILGPFLIALPGIDLTKSFVIAGLFFCLSLIPVTGTQRAQPALPEGERVSPWRLLEIAPAAAMAAFGGGAINSSIVAFGPIWANGLGDPGMAGKAALVMAAIYGASMITQWPLGKLSDGLDRRLVIAGLAAFAGFAALVLSIFSNSGFVLGLIMIGCWGAASMAYYGIAVAHAADRSRAEELPAIASGILMVWAIGSITGPILAGLAFEFAHARGLFGFAGSASLLLASIMIWRRAERRPTPKSEREPFVNLQATSAELAEIEVPEEDYSPEAAARRMED